MARRRVSAVSNHEAPNTSSFETRAKGALLRMRAGTVGWARRRGPLSTLRHAFLLESLSDLILFVSGQLGFVIKLNDVVVSDNDGLI